VHALTRIPRYLFIFSFCGLAVFVPFSIAGANAAIFAGFLAAVISVFADPKARDRYRRIKNDPMLLGCVLLVFSAVPSVLISEDIQRALMDFKSYWLLLVYFLVAYNLISNKLRRLVFWILFGSMTVSSLVALIQYNGGLELGFIKIAAQSYRPGSTLYNMTFAGILYQLITVNLVVAIGPGRFDKTAIAIVTGVTAQIAALFVTLTRGAWLALAAGLMAIPALLKRRKLVLALFGAGLLVVLVAFQNDTIRNRAETLIKNFEAPTDSNVSTRLVLWAISWEVFTDHPILGVGMGDYSIEAEKYLGNRNVLTTVDSHNIYLQILATRGLVGFIPFVVFWVMLFRVLVGSKRRAEQNEDRFARHFVVGTIAATITVLIGALTENNIDDSEVFICFMFLAGIARSFRYQTKTD